MKKPLGETCHFVGGGTPSKRNPAFYEGDIPWATVRDMREEILTRTQFRISREAVNGCATNVVPADNVVIATRVGLGKVCLLNQATAINQDLRGIVPKHENLDVRYLFRWLQSVAHLIEAEGTGATVQGVKLPFIKSLQIPLPTLPEQKRIVAVLDEAFAGISTAVANTEKNLANARELFESYLNHSFLRLPEGERIERLRSLCGQKTITYGVIKLGPDVPDGIPCLRTSNVRRLRIATNGIKRISPELSSQYSRTVLEGGEVLVSVRGTLGGVAVASGAMRGWNVSREVAVVPVDQEKILPPYAAYSIATRESQDWLVGVQKGVAYTGINLMDLRELTVKVPNMKTQLRIVAQLDEMAASWSALRVLYERKLDALTELKQSLLQKAFSGELTAAPRDEIESALA